MAKQTKPRTRTAQDSRPRPLVEYESTRPERRPPQGSAQGEPRLGPYEFRYEIDFGYSTPPALA